MFQDSFQSRTKAFRNRSQFAADHCTLVVPSSRYCSFAQVSLVRSVWQSQLRQLQNVSP